MIQVPESAPSKRTLCVGATLLLLLIATLALVGLGLPLARQRVQFRICSISLCEANAPTHNASLPPFNASDPAECAANLESVAHDTRMLRVDATLLVYNPTIVTWTISSDVALTTPELLSTIKVGNMEATLAAGAIEGCDLDRQTFPAGQWAKVRLECRLAIASRTADLIGRFSSQNTIQIGTVMTNFERFWPRWALFMLPERFVAVMDFRMAPPPPPPPQARRRRLRLSGDDEPAVMEPPPAEEQALKPPLAATRPLAVALLWFIGGDQRGGWGMPLDAAAMAKAEGCSEWAELDGMLNLPELRVKATSYDASNAIIQYLSDSFDCIVPIRTAMIKLLFNPATHGTVHNTVRPTSKGFHLEFSSLILSLAPSACSSSGILRSEVAVAFDLSVYNPTHFGAVLLRPSSGSLRDSRGQLVGEGSVVSEVALPPRATSIVHIVMDFRYLVSRLGLDQQLRPDGGAELFELPTTSLERELSRTNLTIDTSIFLRSFGEELHVVTRRAASFHVTRLL